MNRVTRQLLVMVCLLVLLVLGCGGVLFAGVYDPQWRGDPYSTVQEWNFASGNVELQLDPGLGSVFYRAVPDGLLAVPGNGYIGGPYLPGENPGPYANVIGLLYDESNGTFHVGEDGGHIDFFVPNWIDNHPRKDLRIQITYHSSLVGTSGFYHTQIMSAYAEAYKDYNGSAQDGDRADDTIITSNPGTPYPTSGTGWDDTGLCRYDWWFEPNPDYEWITLELLPIPEDATGNPTYTLEIDSIVIDTISSPVPLPPSLWLLGAGLLGLVGIRRKDRS